MSPGRIQRRWMTAFWMVAISICPVAPANADTLVFNAASSGQQTLDQGEGGGNPFASALIEAMARPSLTLQELPAVLKTLTQQKSKGRQNADVPESVQSGNWQIIPAPPSERRIALVLVSADYSKSGGARSLPGAKRDADRVATALRAAGFTTEIAVDLDHSSIGKKLAQFAAQSQTADAAVIYTTGHGVEVDGDVYLIPGDYPIAERNSMLSSRAVLLDNIGRAMHAKHVNLLFYGGCRDNPFEPID